MPELVKLEADKYLMREGEESTHMYFLQNGTLGVFKMKIDKEVQIGTIYSGELVGEMSFLDKKPRSATVKAISECELLVIPPEKFDAVMNELPQWYTALIKTLLDRLRRANSRIRI